MFSVSFCRTTASTTHEKSRVLSALIRRLRTASYGQCKGDRQSENGGNGEESDNKSKSLRATSAKEKLSGLLKEMMKDGPLIKESAEVNIELAKPKRIKKQKPGVTSSDLTADKNIIEATKNVAESLGGNVKETESELLQKLLSTKGSTNLSEVIGGMAIDHGDTSKTSKESTPKEWIQIRREQGQLGKPDRKVFEGRRQPKFSRGPPSPVDLFGGPRLGIFTGEKAMSKKVQESPASTLRVWDMLEKREIRLATLHPPRNYFQQMILWTEQGKLWKFPIDNEQGLEEESKVFFTEHVFLERHLEPWCPKKGPVRHFMELVCVGLSKNPYLTVSEKKSHIEWYAEYFAAKKDILKEVGALPE